MAHDHVEECQATAEPRALRYRLPAAGAVATLKEARFRFAGALYAVESVHARWVHRLVVPSRFELWATPCGERLSLRFDGKASATQQRADQDAVEALIRAVCGRQAA